MIKIRVLKTVILATIALSFACQPSETGSPESNSSNSFTLDIDLVNPIAEIRPTMYGIFYEDINFAADGGLYAEMIKNRSFEFTEPMMGWEQPKSDRFSMNEGSGFASVINRGQTDVNSNYLLIDVKSDTGYVLTNSGFRGMGVKQGLEYNLSLEAETREGNPELKFELIDESGESIGSTKITPTGKWKNYKASITSTSSAMKATLKISFEGKGLVAMDMISLFPSDTWMNRPKGLRTDLVQKLADLDPGFLRFPGGCIVEGRTLARRYQWKKTVGPIEDRDVLINRWNTEFGHRPTPDYFQSFGLGFFEYFQLSEDIGAEPMPILGCGMACQFNTGELVPLDEMEPYVQDALDLIEFANGSVDSEWGSLRAEMGHPEPFNMKYLGIGNEQWGPEYFKRYVLFEESIKSEYPEIVLVSTSGPFPDGEMFEYGWEKLIQMNAELVDEHYYRNPEWFLENADRYDGYDRDGPKVFAGEYAAQSVAIASPENKNNWRCALAEAAFMTGLERNAEIVHMTSYAPLFAHVEGWQWTPDLIWFNNLESIRTANYEVQKLYATNRGTHVLKLSSEGNPLIGQDGLYATAAMDSNSNELIVKLVNVNGAQVSTDLNLGNVNGQPMAGSLTILQNDDLEAVNSFENPSLISPEKTEVTFQDNFSLTLEPQSLSVLRLKLQ